MKLDPDDLAFDVMMDDLDRLSQLIAGVNFRSLGPDHRLAIFNSLVQVRKEDQLAALVDKAAEIVNQLEEIDGSLSTMHEWFERSDFYRKC